MSQLEGRPLPINLDDLTPKRRERATRIVKSALQILNQGTEYEAIQIREVAERANVSLATIYRFYPSKEQLFAATLLEWQEGLRADTNARPLQGSAPARMSDLALRIIDAFDRGPQYFRLITALEIAGDPVVKAKLSEEEHLARLMFTGLLTGYAAADAKAIVDIVLGVMGNSLRRWARGAIDIAQVRDQLTTTLDIVFSASAVAHPER